jgi:hypothetical protein
MMTDMVRMSTFVTGTSGTEVPSVTSYTLVSRDDADMTSRCCIGSAGWLRNGAPFTIAVSHVRA